MPEFRFAFGQPCTIEREGRDYCATFTFLQRDTGKMDDERSGKEGRREGAGPIARSVAQTRFEQISRSRTRPRSGGQSKCIAKENFHVHHVMLLHVKWPVVVGTVEDQVARPQLRLLQSYRQSVILISLVSAPKGETELHSEVTDGA